MRSKRIVPTSITLGCMVETLVQYREPDAALALLREARGDEQMRTLVNAVVVCSVVKGFSHQRRFNSAWEVYQEMSQAGVELSQAVYNAMFDACARCGEMWRAQDL